MRNVPDAVMLFAAGFGTRMGALTADRPKPLVPVAGRALIDHALALADAAGTARKVVNLHYLGAMIAEHLKGRPDVALSWERETILETGGGLRAALPLLGEGPVFTLNTDAVWTGANPLDELRDGWDGDRMDARLLLMPRDRVRGHAGKGDFDLLPDGRIVRGRSHVYLGAQILDPRAMAAIADPVFSFNRLWDLIIAGGRAFGTEHRGGWCDVGRPEGITEAEALLGDAADA